MKEKISGNLNQGVAKDFAWCVTAPKVAVSHMILGITFFDAWFGICKRDALFTN